MPSKRPAFRTLLLLAALIGCDASHAPASRTPHGGNILPLPESKGSLEIVKQSVEGPGGQVQLTVYFFGPDDKPMPSAPATATFQPNAKGAKPVEFKPAGDPEGSLASAPFSATGTGEVEGEFSATIGGQPVKMSIRVR
jgi:hypothetical protein